jgi:uncharacterized protein (DUF1499 family)
MTPFAWLLGLFLPACGAMGALGVAVPQPMDMAHIVRPSSPNTALAAPAGFSPTPDIVTPTYPEPATQLFTAVKTLAAGQPRTFLAAAYPAQLQLHYVVRSAVFNFPDLLAVQVTAEGADASRLVLYSRSVYGRSDFGVNRERLLSWLTALPSARPSSGER